MIKVNYESTRAAARKLQEVASECGDMVRKANQLNDSIPSCWEGSAAQVFSREITEWSQETKMIQTELESLARDIIRIVNEFEAAEARLAAETHGFSRNTGGGSR